MTPAIIVFILIISNVSISPHANRFSKLFHTPVGTWDLYHHIILI
ncbi:hypothetical protein HMPREF2533_01641 [Bacteroides fragilis]|nr:hypothetical protein HMPREF2530_01641 [Bacteroides fragilis]KXU47387.1 hypothetical protein HMPREF2533_01641 [Bacteroides fragilis]